ncbi:hypothetical protein [Jiangella alba]|uniref:Uncharacterized protein n=1 Tax=Jiangella alba TaxID=561176 RepID=A0A1H5HA84_9ACTN|nr:hypothetical protein [Jiangella alba]SEE24882.1 hypothetical protein SAMN04488561_0798 [Jiangella alba]
MTSGNDGADGDGVRHAAESLRAALDALPDLAEHLDGAVRARIDATTGAVEAAAAAAPAAEIRRSLLGTAHEIRLLGTHLTATREDTFAEVAHTLTQHADEIDALLRPAPDGAGAAPVVPAPPPVPAPSVQTSALDAAAVQRQLPDAAAQRRAINQVVAQFPPMLQHLARTLLLGHSSHAVERHGHHLRRDHQIARVQWRLDPAGVDGWRLNSDGSAESWRKHGNGPHGVGTAAGNYASPHAVARPLIALLEAAGRTQAALDGYLNGKANGQTVVKLFLHPSDTGITTADLHTVRAPGTDTIAGASMWDDAREGSMAGHGDPPAVREYDTIGQGDRPGSMIMFVRRPNQPWRLVTSYFMDDTKNTMRYTEL